MDKPNFFDVTVWGAQGENCASYLEKGRPVAIDGRLEWREWEASDGSGKRQGVEIVAERVQFLSSGRRDERPPAAAAAEEHGERRSEEDPGEGGYAAALSGDDDIPF